MELSDEEKRKVEHQVEHFVTLMQRRYGMTDEL